MRLVRVQSAPRLGFGHSYCLDTHHEYINISLIVRISFPLSFNKIFKASTVPFVYGQ